MFRVQWLQSSLDALAEGWVQAESEKRRTITLAAHAIEQRLAEDPAREGESRAKGRRTTFAPPLAVTFQVERDGRTVSILHVRVFRRRR